MNFKNNTNESYHHAPVLIELQRHILGRKKRHRFRRRFLEKVRFPVVECNKRDNKRSDVACKKE